MKEIKARPVISTSVVLWGDDQNRAHVLRKGENCEGTLISFDRRQVWKVYPYKRRPSDTGYWGACSYRNVYLRLGEKDLLRIFGEDIIERAKA